MINLKKHSFINNFMWILISILISIKNVNIWILLHFITLQINFSLLLKIKIKKKMNKFLFWRKSSLIQNLSLFLSIILWIIFELNSIIFKISRIFLNFQSLIIIMIFEKLMKWNTFFSIFQWNSILKILSSLNIYFIIVILWFFYFN